MKAITISQPFASLIASGEKWVENRSWPTRYRGPILIHAGKGTQYMTLRAMAADSLPAGKIVAIANLDACVSLDRVQQMDGVPDRRCNAIPGASRLWWEVAHHEHTEGPCCWILGSVQKLDDPVACRGAQGLWNHDLVKSPNGTLLDALGHEP